MNRRRKDRFADEIASIHRASRKQRAARQRRRADSHTSPIEASLEDLQVGLRITGREFGALRREVGRGVVREFGSLGKDFLVTFLTLGTIQPPSMRNGRRSRRSRRRYP